MKKIVFISYPDISDNSFALLKKLLESEKKYEYIWLVRIEDLGKQRKKLERYLTSEQIKKIRVIKKNNLIGLWHNFTAKYIVNTHGSFEQFPILKWQKKINLWHGMPLKNIAALDRGTTTIKMSCSIASSPLFQDILAKSFLLKKSKVLPVGSPRNDFFFYNNDELKKELEINENQKVYIWMPTYRQSAEGDIRLDGTAKNEIAGIKEGNYFIINEKFKKENKILYIKLHPMDVLNKREYKNNFSNIKIIRSDEFLDLGCEVNHFLSLADVLITDYSSVYFDFALLNRPIILYTDDQESYKNSRGFTSQKLMDVMKESLTISTPEELLEALSQPVEKLPVISKEANNIINQYTLEILEKNKTITGEVIKSLGL